MLTISLLAVLVVLLFVTAKLVLRRLLSTNSKLEPPSNPKTTNKPIIVTRDRPWGKNYFAKITNNPIMVNKDRPWGKNY
ncbi:hypothetical protein O6P43_001639 [Quillaja saponaria]|uniref:Uncharacterized protein n=1 Tax=Quillaja saponaria TaxID=32244 RepID=A0AAD7VNX8_QUISA|nr:hypothetical protein O6P43_001639 [Quillaja saponaria]